MSPARIVRLRPPALAVASRIVQLYPSFVISSAVVIPAIPPPRMTTDFPAPTLASQSPGRGDCIPGDEGGAGGGGGLGAAPGAADDAPQLASEVPMPIAAIVLNIAELPTALPTAVRNSRRRNPVRSDFTPSPALLMTPVLPERILQNSDLYYLFRLTSRLLHYIQYDPEPWTEFPQ